MSGWGRLGTTLAAALAIGAVLPEQSGTRDITADAVTRATVRNIYRGEVSSLTDGHAPDDDGLAGALSWEGLGMVTVSWPDTVRLSRIQAYVSGVSRYRIFGYLGGGFSDRGDREGTETAASGGASGWWDITPAADVAIDNLSFQVIDGGAIYEMRFFAVGEPAQGGFSCRGLTSVAP